MVRVKRGDEHKPVRIRLPNDPTGFYRSTDGETMHWHLQGTI